MEIYSRTFTTLWWPSESGGKSNQTHFKKVMGEVKLTFEELVMTTSQIEACINSIPLTLLPDKINGIEALIPGRSLIGHPLEVIPDECQDSLESIKLLHRWQFCQALVRQFWK